jgi:DNA-binding NarL/FixJ family response regulator
MSRLCVFLIDDHPLYRSGLRMVLQSGLDNPLIHEMDAVEEALKLAVKPDLLLLDIFLAGMDGLSSIAMLKSRWPTTAVLVVSSETSSETVKKALDGGADAFLSKAQSPARMIEAIHQVLRTGEQDESQTNPQTVSAQALSERQLQVLSLLAQGLSNRMIGQRLFLSEHTIRWHVQAILAALGASSRSEAVFVARQKGMIQ